MKAIVGEEMKRDREGSFARMRLVLLLTSWSVAPNRCQTEVLSREKRTSRKELSQGRNGVVDSRREHRLKKVLLSIFNLSLFSYVFFACLHVLST